VDAHELLHEVHALLPQCDEIGRTRLGSNGASCASSPSITAILSSRTAASAAERPLVHPCVRVVALELLLERRRLLLHARELGARRWSLLQNGRNTRSPASAAAAARPERPHARGGAAARPERHPAPPASGPAPAAAPAAPSAARRAGTAPRAPPDRPRIPPRAAAPTRTLPRPAAPTIVHRAVHHRDTPSSSIRRNRT